LMAIAVLAQVEVSGGSNAAQPWWKIATGIIAVPAALLGLYYTYRLQKRRDASRRSFSERHIHFTWHYTQEHFFFRKIR